jgi:phosphate transport system protein
MSRSNEPRTSHISRRYHYDLDGVKTHLLEMGGFVEKQLVLALESLLDSDSGLAQSVMDADPQVNELERAIDEECTRILVCRQPAAGDLRLIIAIGKINTDLERIGDEVVSIARQAIALSEIQPSAAGYPQLRRIGGQVCDMLREALDAIARSDAQLALSVARDDQRVDRVCAAAVSSMVMTMEQDPSQISSALNVIWALRALERVGDHAMNIAEYVIYLVKGADVRHRDLQHMAAQVLGDDE